MKVLQAAFLLVLLAIMFLQYREQQRATEAVRVLTEILAEAVDAQDCDREEVLSYDLI